MTNKQRKNIKVYLIAIISAIFLTNISGCSLMFLDKPVPVVKEIKYSQFIQQLEQGKVKNVGLSVDRTRALVQHKDGTKEAVNLPPDDNQLISTIQKNVKGNIYVLRASDESGWVRVMHSLFLPFLLICLCLLLFLGLFFLLKSLKKTK
jgi:cell division protease FtsH